MYLSATSDHFQQIENENFEKHYFTKIYEYNGIYIFIYF